MTKYFIALAALLGTIIGAGILGIPYVVMRSGFPIGLMHLAIIGIIITIVMLYLGEIALRTKTKHQLTGYAQKYLGKKGKILMFLAASFGLYSAILAYLIGEGASLSHLIFNTGYYSFILSIIFWVILSFILYLGIKAFEGAESLAVIVVFIMIISIAVFASNKIDINNLTYINTTNFFVPFGVILFAYLGFSIIPELENILGNEKKKLKKVIISVYILVFLVYVLFTLSVLGFKGSLTPEIATIALGKPFIFLGILTMFTAYLALSTALIDTYNYDFKIPRTQAWLLTILVPFILFLALELVQKTSFIKVLSIGGVISGGLTGILILLMAKKAKRHGDLTPQYSIPYSIPLAILIAIIFVLGAILEIINIAG